MEQTKAQQEPLYTDEAADAANVFADEHGVYHVETDEAHYGLYPGIPLLGEYMDWFASDVSEEAVAAADAFVVENADTGYDALDMDHLMDDRQAPILEQNLAQDDPAPVYVVDVPTKYAFLGDEVADSRLKEWLPYRKGVKSATRGLRRLYRGFRSGRRNLKPVFRSNPFLLPLAAPRLSGLLGLAPRFLDTGHTVASRAQQSKCYTTTGVRSAITAEKLDEYVAPRVAAEQDEKPAILVEYSMEDLDIGAYLERPDRRRSVIDANLEFDNYVDVHTIDHDALNTVCEFRFTGGGYDPDTELDEVVYEKLMHEMDGVSAAEDSVVPHYRRPLNVFWPLDPSMLIEQVEERGERMAALDGREHPDRYNAVSDDNED